MQQNLAKVEGKEKVYPTILLTKVTHTKLRYVYTKLRNKILIDFVLSIQALLQQLRTAQDTIVMLSKGNKLQTIFSNN